MLKGNLVFKQFGKREKVSKLSATYSMIYLHLYLLYNIQLITSEISIPLHEYYINLTILINKMCDHHIYRSPSLSAHTAVFNKVTNLHIVLKDVIHVMCNWCENLNCLSMYTSTVPAHLIC